LGSRQVTGFPFTVVNGSKANADTQLSVTEPKAWPWCSGRVGPDLHREQCVSALVVSRGGLCHAKV
jgi:hypothetical protein